MRESLTAIALGVLTACIGHAQNIVGDWNGTLNTGQAELRLVLHIAKSGDGYTATLDSIDQGANGIPVSSVSLKGSKLSLTVDAVKGSYEGNISADGTEIAGTWSQGQPLPLNFRRGLPQKADVKSAKPTDIDGTWEGTLDTGGTKLRVVFHITNTEQGLSATMDSPDQGAKGIPVTSVTRNGSILTMDLKAIGGKFEGKIADDRQSIEGTWSQGQGSAALLLKHSS